MTTKSDERGLTLTNSPSIERQLMKVLDEAWLRGFTVQSRFARSHAELVAMAASLQLISSRINRDLFGCEWQITSKGLRWLNENKELK